MCSQVLTKMLPECAAHSSNPKTKAIRFLPEKIAVCFISAEGRFLYCRSHKSFHALFY